MLGPMGRTRSVSWAPNFGYADSHSAAWTLTWARLLLGVLPTAGPVAGGAILLNARPRPAKPPEAGSRQPGCHRAAPGPSLSRLLTADQSPATVPTGSAPIARSVQEIGFCYGAGAAALATLSLGHLGVKPRDDEDSTRHQYVRPSCPETRTGPGLDMTQIRDHLMILRSLRGTQHPRRVIRTGRPCNDRLRNRFAVI